MENKEYQADPDYSILQRKHWKQNHCSQLLYKCCLQTKQSDTSLCARRLFTVPPSIPYLGPGRVPPPSHVTVSSALLPGARLGLAAAEAVVDLLYLPLQPAVLGAVDLQGAVPQSALGCAFALPRDVPPEPRRANESCRALGLSRVFDIKKEYTLLKGKCCLFVILPNALWLPKKGGSSHWHYSLQGRSCHQVPLTGSKATLQPCGTMQGRESMTKQCFEGFPPHIPLQKYHLSR